MEELWIIGTYEENALHCLHPVLAATKGALKIAGTGILFGGPGVAAGTSTRRQGLATQKVRYETTFARRARDLEDNKLILSIH